MSLFDEYSVYVQDPDGTIAEYKEIGFLAANGRSGLYRRMGLNSWIVRNDWNYRSKKSIIREMKDIARLIRNDGHSGLADDVLKELPLDGVIDTDE